MCREEEAKRMECVIVAILIGCEVGFWLRMVLAYAIACALQLGLVWLVNEPSRTGALIDFMYGMLKVPLIALLWPLSYTLWPKKVGSTGT
jgi:hypothetical protein